MYQYIYLSNFQVIKHALRQQAKRRRKNTTIASGNSITPLPRLVVKTNCAATPCTPSPSAPPRASTMQEVNFFFLIYLYIAHGIVLHYFNEFVGYY
jgi:hypothetical protein